MDKPYHKPINCTVCKKAVGVAHLIDQCTWEHKRDAVCRPCYDSMSKKHDDACEYSRQLTIARRKVESENRKLKADAERWERRLNQVRGFLEGEET